MATFNDIAAGPRKRQPSFLPLPGARFNVERNAWDGPHAALDIIALEEGAYEDAVREARAHAVKQGLSDPRPGDEIYDRALMRETLARACLDQSNQENESPFFPGGAEQIRSSRIMTPEVVEYLHTVQELHQDAVNPLAKDLSAAEYMAAVLKTAGGDPSFFASSRPGTQWSFLHTLASQLAGSMMHASASGGPSGAADAKTET